MNGQLKIKMKGIFFLLYLALVVSCGGRKSETGVQTGNEQHASAKDEVKYVNSIRFISPEKNAVYRYGDQLDIKLDQKDKFVIDSLVLYLNGDRFAVSQTPQFTLKLPEMKVGKMTLKVMAFHPENKRGVATLSLVVKPDEAPQKYNYEVVKVLPHDPKAYTQGLIYRDGFMYEGTGQYGESSVRKTDMKNNSILSVLNIDNQYFGEGLTIYKDKIYQITWKSRKGFVYDLETFTLESTFNYNSQGWGITTLDNELVMSDGSNKLYYMSPSSFGIIREIEVYDNNGEVANLNELEYIDGLIWANVWLTDRIVMIDPKTGAVKGELDMTKLLPVADRNKLDDSDDVLNGIAYNPGKGTVYLTGKRWPKMFEVKVKKN